MKKIIEIRNLSYAYPDGKVALRSVSLDVFEGETVGVIGPNGAGKTTLLLHLNGILRSRAEIKVLGREIASDTLKYIRSRVGLVFQDPDDQLFSPTVFDDVAFGPTSLGLDNGAVIARVRNALRLVGLDGYEGKISHHLSSGEKKRVSIATVLSLPCEILVLDEPTSNLDPRARKNLMGVLQELPPAKIIAGHDLGLIFGMSNRIIVLDRGSVVAQGTPREIAQNRVLAERYHLEFPSMAYQ